MKLIKLSLVLMSFCFFGNGYAMEDKKEQIAKDLRRAQMLTAQAEHQVQVAQRYQIDNEPAMEDIEFALGQHSAALELAYEAHVASMNIVNDNIVPHKIRNRAQSYAKKALWILDKYNSETEEE